MKCYQHPVTTAKVYENLILDSPESSNPTLNQPNSPDPSTINASNSLEKENEIIPDRENVTIKCYTCKRSSMETEDG